MNDKLSAYDFFKAVKGTGTYNGKGAWSQLINTLRKNKQLRDKLLFLLTPILADKQLSDKQLKHILEGL
jgi:hypothetical protein